MTKRSDIAPLLTAIFWLLLLYQPMAMAAGHSRQSLEAIRSAAASFLKHQRWHSPGKLQIHTGQLDPRLRLHRCSKKLQAFMPPGSRRSGNTSVGIRCTDHKPWKLYVPVSIKLIGRVFASANYLPRGTVIQATDLKRVEYDLARLQQGYFSTADKIIGKVLKQAVPGGGIITPAHLSRPRLVRRGESVIIMAKASGIEIRMKGKALTDGAAGELVRVKNIKSQRIIEGTVEHDGIIRVPF